MNPSSFYMAKAGNSPTGGGGARDPHKGRYKIISLSLTKIVFFPLIVLSLSSQNTRESGLTKQVPNMTRL